MKWWWLLVLVFAACGDSKKRDEAQARLVKAEARFQTLVLQGVRPQAPAYDALLAELAAVPTDVPASKKARELERRITDARVRPPPLPLAQAKTGVDGPQVSAQAEACVALAKVLGTTDGGPERERVAKALDECRAKVSKLEREAHERQAHEEAGGEKP